MNKDNKAHADKIKSYLNDCYFDFVGVSPNAASTPIDEAQLAKMVARIAVSAVTIFTTAVSLKQYFKEHPAFFIRKNKL